MSLLIHLKVHPDAKEDRIEPSGVSAFEIWCRAPAENGRANARCLELLAAYVGFPAKRLRIARGAKTRSKIVEVLGT